MAGNPNDVVILDGCRTPFGNFGGSLIDFRSYQLGAYIIPKVIERAGVDPSLITYGFFGHSRQAGMGVSPCATAMMMAGHEIPTSTINTACSSSGTAVQYAYYALRSGEHEVVIAGGMESMSNIPHLVYDVRWNNHRMKNLEIKDGWLHPGPPGTLDANERGGSAESMATKYGLTREELDQFGLESHQKAARAWANGWYDDEVVPIPVPANGKKPGFLFAKDEHVRPNITLEDMLKVPAAFGTGTTAATNSSGMVDGACAMILTTRRKAQELGLKPRGSIVSTVTVAGPTFEQPPKAIALNFKKAGMTWHDIDYIEINEAFASQVVANERVAQWDRSKLNVHGGGIGIGHPVGVSGARIIFTLLNVLKIHDGEIGITANCGVTCPSFIIKRES